LGLDVPRPAAVGGYIPNLEVLDGHGRLVLLEAEDDCGVRDVRTRWQPRPFTASRRPVILAVPDTADVSALADPILAARLRVERFGYRELLVARFEYRLSHVLVRFRDVAGGRCAGEAQPDAGLNRGRPC
jgi:hypothetical protein